MKRHWYLYYGVIVSGWLAYSVIYGWSWFGVEQAKTGPKTVRESGAHRPHYGSWRRWFSGK